MRRIARRNAETDGDLQFGSPIAGRQRADCKPDAFADIRGRTLLVDAPDTAYALLARKLLARHGLQEGTDYKVKAEGRGGLRYQALLDNEEYAAAVLNLRPVSGLFSRTSQSRNSA